jgi:hypothetical protein
VSRALAAGAEGYISIGVGEGELVGAVEAAAFVATDDGAFERELSRLDGRPLTVREALAEHAAHHEASAQCVGLVDDLVATAVEAAR